MDTYIYHHGIKGMKWGIRRYQNKDGSLTSAGKKKYNNKTSYDKNKHRIKNIVKTQRVAVISKIASKALNSIGQKYYNKYSRNATPLNVAVTRGLGYSSKALNIIGDVAITSNVVQRYKYARDYWKS